MGLCGPAAVSGSAGDARLIDAQRPAALCLAIAAKQKMGRAGGRQKSK